MARIVKLATAVVQANYHWTYARVYSDADGGLYGTGECFFAPGLSRVIEEFSEVLVGEDPNNIEKLVERMRWAASAAGSMGGIVWNAISAIEAALWDLKGKALGVPVWELMGGTFRDEVRIYLDCHAAGALESQTPLQQIVQPAWDTGSIHTDLSPDEIIAASAERAKEVAREGYTALKFDLDLPGSTFDQPSGYPLRTRDIDWMSKLTHALREAVGPDIDLAMDAHWRYRANDILQVANAVADCRLMWFEDPVPPWNLESLRYIRSHTTTPIATGEHLQLREGFWHLIVDDLCDIVTPDLQKLGGLAEAKKVADMAATANKPYGPHMIGSPLALMATANVSVTIPNFMVCEFHAHDVPFFHEMVEGGTAEWFRPGWVKVLDRPGFGVELNPTVGKRYRVPGTRWFDEG